MIRNNKQIWNIAEWSWWKGPRTEEHWNYVKDEQYDMIVEFLKKLQNNDFTGPDNHGD